MTDQQTSPAGPPNRIPKRLRIIGASVLVVGALAAGLVYWLGSRNGDLSDDLSMQGFSRAEQRQMGQLYGKSGLLIDQLEDALKQPGTQAIIIVAAAVLVAAGCFYFARLTDDSGERG